MIMYQLILFVVSLIILVLGIKIYKGNTKLIHSYHQENIKKEDLNKYAKAFAMGMFSISFVLFFDGVLSFITQNFLIIDSFLLIGLVLSLIYIISVQKKFNKKVL